MCPSRGSKQVPRLALHLPLLCHHRLPDAWQLVVGVAASRRCSCAASAAELWRARRDNFRGLRLVALPLPWHTCGRRHVCNPMCATAVGAGAAIAHPSAPSMADTDATQNQAGGGAGWVCADVTV